MTASTLGIPQVAANQDQKEVTINEADQALEDLSNLTTAIDVAATFTLTDDQYRSGIRFLLSDDGVSAGFNMRIPANARLFIVKNDTGETCTIGVDPDEDGFDGDTVDVYDGQSAIIVCDGTDCEILQIGGAGSQVDTWEPIVVTSTTPTLQPEWAGKAVILTNSSAITLTVEDDATVPIGIGKWFRIIQGGAGTVTVAGSGASVNSQDALTDLAGTFAGAVLWHYATDNWHLEGNLA